jgi:serine protease AprX
MLQFLSITLFALFLTSCISGSHASDRENDLQDPQVFDAWVEFRNKGIETDEQRTEMIAFLERNYNPKALERRKTKRTFPGLFDERDFPVRETYLDLVSQTGATIMIVSRWLNGTSVLATSDQLQEIKTLECVQWVGDIHKHINKRNQYDDPAYTQKIIDPGDYPRDFDDYEAGLYGLSSAQIRQINLHSVHEQGFTGKGVIITILDSGFDLDHKAFNHPDNPIRVIKQWDLVNNDLNTKPEKTDPLGQHLHGTLCLGTIAAYAPDELVGSGYDASYILCVPEDVIEEYPLEERWFVAALEYAESNGADLITSSLVLYDYYENDQLNGETSVMSIGWNIATGNGVIGVQGGGNAGHDSNPETNHLETPADAYDVITVGAVDRYGFIARFSSDGPTADGRLKPEILGRGLETYTVSGHDHNLYTTASGASIATPLVAGAIACILQAYPEWSVEELRTNLFKTGHYFREHGTWDTTFVQGYGIPDFSLMLTEK